MNTTLAETNLQADAASEMGEQYSLAKILGIWALVTLPMPLLTWVVTPALIPLSPLHPGITFWLMTIAGMMWQFVVALIIVYRERSELGTLRSHSAALRGPWWSALRQRLWLQTPRNPGTDKPNARLYWWLLPLLLLSGVVNFVIDGALDAPMTWLFPRLQEPEFMKMEGLASPEFVGQWWLLGVALVSIAFNYFLGEEFLFRGVLLPKMKGVFGKYDWMALAVLFGLYHLHKPWSLPSTIASNLVTTWPAARFRSNWMAVIIHGVQGLMVLFIVLGVILGLMTG